ncbi:uncharacterized protein [Nicotiana tomentosiformis]|uniref:uncharacterized protein n=1 Tax=Nicotiana tomentosiformis TaxID=4098 RepID=UPI00388C833E
MAEDSKLLDVICDRPFVPTKNLGDPVVAIPNTRKKFNDVDRKAIEKNFRAKKILVCGIGPHEYNRISACQLAKEIWEALQTAYEGTTQERKVNAITEAKDLQTLTIDELVGNLKTYEMKKKKDNKRREPKREKNLVLKIDNNDSSGEDGDMAYLTRRFQKMVCMNGGIPKRVNSSKPKYYDLCHKCGKPGHFIKECPLLKQDQYKNNFDKAAKRNPVHDKCFKRKNVAGNVIKQAFAAWRESSSESEEENDHGDSSMMAVENTLTVELGEAEQTRDDLVIVVVDLKETIENLKKEKDALDENIANIEHERDDLMVVVVDLKETFECVRKEKEVLAERVANIEHKRDDLLVVVVDLKETIGEPKIESRPENSQKGKEVANEAHIKLERRVKSDLEKSLNWTWSSDAITAMYTNNGGNMQGIGFQREKIPYNPHSKYVTVPDNWLCTHCGTLGTLKKTGTMKGSNLQWYMDSGFSKHMTVTTQNFPPTGP